MADPTPIPRNASDCVLSLEGLRQLAVAHDVDDVIVAIPDLAGRLQGSRVAVEQFLNEVVTDGFAACSYLLACDVEMQARAGYSFSPWDDGFGDLVVRPDLQTLRRLPWQPRTALVLGDAHWADAGRVVVAPRQVLRQQLDRLTGRGLQAMAATELELRVFRQGYRDALERDYRDLDPATAFNVDYSLIGLGPLDEFGADLRATMRALGYRYETARGECAPGQYEITFRYACPLQVADGHVLYKTAAKTTAASHGLSATFMAKFDAAEGNSGHVHFSLRSSDGHPVFAGTGTGQRRGMSPLMEHFVAGQLACLPELMLLFAPTLNSYKRLRPGSFAPTSIAWGRDNRTCPIRVVGAGSSLRFEHRVPGADTNPYLVLAAIIAAGLHGIDRQLELTPAVEGNAFADPSLRSLPTSLHDALAAWEGSDVAAAAFGPEVVTHMSGAARAELDSFGSIVTDWERRRGFERI